MSNAQEMMREALNRKSNQVLDATSKDSGLSGADTYTQKDITLKAVATVQSWVETDDLDDGESYADRLLALVVGIADDNKDGEISEDEQGVVDIALNAIWDYLAKFDADDADISALLNDWDDDAGERIRDLLASSMPEGEDNDADLDNFVFGSDQSEVFDAVYKKTMAIRSGKKVRINKRISGVVRLSAKQKIGIRKAQMKSHSAVAMMHRAKSMRMRVKSGLK
jgi:hypothetical protein